MLDDRFIQGLKAADKPKKYADAGQRQKALAAGIPL